MKITLAKHGGPGADVHPLQVVDIRTLPDDSALELSALVGDAIVAEAPDDGPSSARHAVRYTITVEENGYRVELTQADTVMTSAFASLVQSLERHLVAC